MFLKVCFKVISFVFLLSGTLFFHIPAFSQVTIGSDKSPHLGAALELISNDDKGLLLPKVNLTSATDWSPISGTEVDGMVVYNTNNSSENGLKGFGLYVWSDDQWNILDGGGTEVVIEVPGIVDSRFAKIYGPVCYDVGQSNFSADCGSASSRTPAFPANDPSKRMRTYEIVFSPVVPVNIISDLEAGVNYDFRGIIESVSATYTSMEQSGSLLVVFSENVNTIAQGTTPYGGTEISVTLWASYKINDVKLFTTLEITVQDCACCPKSAFLVPNGVFNPKDGNDYTSNSNALTHYDQVPGSALCVFPLDGHFGQSWDVAKEGCENGKFVPGQGPDEGWRLPNAGEMANLLQKDTYLGYGLTAYLSNMYRYWSITEAGSPGATNAFYIGLELSNPTAKPSPMSVGKVASKAIGVRCVKTVGE